MNSRLDPNQEDVSGGWNSGIAAVIPCYKVVKHIEAVIARIGPEVDRIYCVDDACPEHSGDYIEKTISDPRVRVVRNAVNLGVGGAVINGYRHAIKDGATVMVKIDGDGQMDPGLVGTFVAPILNGEADYTKGNRFFDLQEIKQMPLLRRIGNLGLSFLAKASTGYWDIFDPTNGYTAIHSRAAARLPFDSISNRYFFETDMLFRLNTLRGVVIDIPMDAHYGDEVSNLKVSKVFGEFLGKHLRNLFKRVIYNYYLRDMPIASLELAASGVLLAFGSIFGIANWWISARQDVSTPLGTIMIATVCIVSGLQFLLAFLAYDTSAIPRRPIHLRLK
ncbi:MAG: glycosyltransferase family 2 protein [Pseudoxanthomonas sp.]